MADIVDRATRSRMMAGIRGKDTKPELEIRRALHRKGFRFRLHAKDLPGRPDILLPRYNVAILVHGCFWHGHDCPYFKRPSTRQSFWLSKIAGTKRRDERKLTELLELGWRVLIVWECALRDRRPVEKAELNNQVAEWIRGDARTATIPFARSLTSNSDLHDSRGTQ